MPQLNPPAPILQEGPFVKKAALTGQNLRLLCLLLPAGLMGLLFQNENIWGSLGGLGLVLGASLLLTLVLTWPGKRLADLDWAVSGLMAWLLLPAESGTSYIQTAAFLGCGGLCGLLSAPAATRPLLKSPALVPFIAVFLTCLGVKLGVAAIGRSGDYILSGAIAPWPQVLALTLAGACYAADQVSDLYLLLPWLAGLGAVMLFPFPPNFPAGSEVLFFGPKTLALVTAAFFILPQFSLGRVDLIVGEVILSLFIILETIGGGTASGYSADSGLWLLPILGLALSPSVLAAVSHKPRRPQTPFNQPELSASKAALRCGHQGLAPRLAQWSGLTSCRLAAQHDGGPLVCPYGCLSLGDCARQCPYGAIVMIDGFPRHKQETCRGCGLCLKACPKNLWALERNQGQVYIACSALSNLKLNADYCPQSCLGCGRCKKACPAGAIDRTEPMGAMIVDQKLCLAFGRSCQKACTQVCPRGCLKPGDRKDL